MKTFQVYTIILDSFSDTSPSAPSLSTNAESQFTTTFQTRNVTAVTPSKRTRSQITVTFAVSSSSITSRPPITKIPITSRSQTSAINTLLVHIPNLESVERYVNYKQPTVIKTVRLQPKLNIVHIPDTEYTTTSITITIRNQHDLFKVITPVEITSQTFYITIKPSTEYI